MHLFSILKATYILSARPCAFSGSKIEDRRLKVIVNAMTRLGDILQLAKIWYNCFMILPQFYFYNDSEKTRPETTALVFINAIIIKFSGYIFDSFKYICSDC